MNPFEESIPEEREEQQAQLIALLRQAYRQEQTLLDSEQQEAILRVGARLARKTEHSPARAGRVQEGATGVSLLSVPSRSVRQSQVRRALSTAAVVLVVGALIGSAVLLFTQRGHQMQSLAGPTGTPDLAGPVGPVGTPVTTEVDWAGLEMSMKVTPGPYFLGELLAVDLSLTNQTQPTLTLAGWIRPPETCGATPLSIEQTGGTSPHYTPYPMPVSRIIFCTADGPDGQALAPGETVEAHTYLLLTSSGDVTLTGVALFHLSKVSPESSPGPLTGHLPTLVISVMPQVPGDRIFSLQQEDSKVVIQAPSGLQLLDQTYVICQFDANHPWASGIGHDYWESLSTNVLQRPACAGNGLTFAQWNYAVGAAGYEVVQGQQGQYSGPPFP